MRRTSHPSRAPDGSVPRSAGVFAAFSAAFLLSMVLLGASHGQVRAAFGANDGVGSNTRRATVLGEMPAAEKRAAPDTAPSRWLPVLIGSIAVALLVLATSGQLVQVGETAWPLGRRNGAAVRGPPLS